jgi:hypothetical protein
MLSAKLPMVRLGTLVVAVAGGRGVLVGMGGLVAVAEDAGVGVMAVVAVGVGDGTAVAVAVFVGANVCVGIDVLVALGSGVLDGAAV